MFSGRTGAASKQGVAMVTIGNNVVVHGLILLPDTWTLPAGLTFTSGFDSYTRNQYTAAEWERMEAAGAVFLPAAGRRYGTEVDYAGEYGYYWSSTPNNAYANLMYINANSVNFRDNIPRNFGYSVRLVQDYYN